MELINLAQYINKKEQSNMTIPNFEENIIVINGIKKNKL